MHLSVAPEPWNESPSSTDKYSFERLISKPRLNYIWRKIFFFGRGDGAPNDQNRNMFIPSVFRVRRIKKMRMTV